MRIRRLLIAILLIAILLIVYRFPVFSLSAECDQPAVSIPREKWDVCREEYEKEAQLLASANATNKEELTKLQKQLTSLTQKIKALGNQITTLEKNIQSREVDLGLQQELLFVRVRNFYIKSRYASSLLILFSSRTAAQLTHELALKQSVVNQDKALIFSFAQKISQLKQDKEVVQKNKSSLLALEKQVDEKAKFLAGEVEKTESYLAALTAKQKEIEALKAGGFAISVGETPPTLEPCSGPPGSANFCDPGFSPAFAAFSFGAPHRKGLSQFGAFGRAKAGQSAEQILKAYYGEGIEIKKDYSTGININVRGYGTVDLETYTKRIYEMPSSWGEEGGFEALKAQAVAARSYALAYTNNGAGSICATEACQVYKPANKGGKWEEAVNATRGWVLVAGGQPFSAWYASTAGGYTFSYSSNGFLTPGLWDTPRGRDGWPDEAWEKKAASPWFYKAWYRTRSGSTCGRSHPWLTTEELADILNAWQVLYQGGGDAARVSPATTACWSGNPYSISELQSIGGYNSVSLVSVVYGSDGVTQTVTFQTNKGSRSLGGDEFKRAFNLRAPGYIGVKSSLFNLVQK